MLLMMTACRQETEIFIPEEVPIGKPEYTSITGLYLLNEGNMGSNKATLDYYDYATATYTRNVYASANPNVPKELGDVGNDLQVYGGRLYAVINGSNKVEVMDVRTAKRIGQVDIPNCRYICFAGKYAYVTSYAGPVDIDPDYKQTGYVAKVDTATLQIVGKCLVGMQPDGLAISGNKLYVANSGGYVSPNYENTVSVIDLNSFTEMKRIPTGINLYRICSDEKGQMWVCSRGDYYDVPSQLYCIDTKSDRVTDTLDVACSGMWIDGDSLYFYGSAWSNVNMAETLTYGIVNIQTKESITDRFITDGTEQNIKKPFGIAVHPITKDIYLTDARNYVTPGTLYCFDENGKKKWEVRTGDAPAHIAFTGQMK